MRKHDPQREALTAYYTQCVHDAYKLHRRAFKGTILDPAPDEPDVGERMTKLRGPNDYESDKIELMMYEPELFLDAFIRKLMLESISTSKKKLDSREEYDALLGQTFSSVTDKMVTISEHFMEAAEHGRAEEVMALVNEGFPLNYQDPVSGKSALHLAAASCARLLILAIIKTGTCNFLLRDKKGRLASEMAFVYGDDVALARLLRIKEGKQAESEGIKLTRRPRPEGEPA